MQIRQRIFKDIQPEQQGLQLPLTMSERSPPKFRENLAHGGPQNTYVNCKAQAALGKSENETLHFRSGKGDCDGLPCGESYIYTFKHIDNELQSAYHQ